MTTGNKRKANHFFTGSGTHFKRALSLDPSSVEPLPEERSLLAGGLDGGSEPFGQLLLWRRSFLFVTFLVLVPTLLIEAISTIIQLAGNPDFGGVPIDRGAFGILGGLQFLVLCLNVTLGVGVFLALKRWADWRRSRKVLLVTWVLAFLAPFVTSLFPLRALGGRNEAVAIAMGTVGALVGIVSLAPKAVSLIPGLMRAAITAKVLFPRSTAPGPLIALAAPFYLLLVYVVLLAPFQMSGSPFFVIAIIAFILAPIWLWRSAPALAKPVDRPEAITLVKKTRLVSVALNAIGAVFLLIGLLAGGLPLNAFDILELLLAIGANVMVLSVVGIDLMTTILARTYGTPDDPAEVAQIARFRHEMVQFAAAAQIEAPLPKPTVPEEPGA